MCCIIYTQISVYVYVLIIQSMHGCVGYSKCYRMCFSGGKGAHHVGKYSLNSVEERLNTLEILGYVNQRS